MGTFINIIFSLSTEAKADHMILDIQAMQVNIIHDRLRYHVLYGLAGLYSVTNLRRRDRQRRLLKNGDIGAEIIGNFAFDLAFVVPWPCGGNELTEAGIGSCAIPINNNQYGIQPCYEVNISIVALHLFECPDRVTGIHGTPIPYLDSRCF